ncbi:hypothetical protein EJ02DRAFT_451285, partial [Clathrospora elynae]
MDKAIEDLESWEEGEQLGYSKVAEKFDIDESTLRRRHQGKCSTRAEAAQNRQKLHP